MALEHYGFISSVTSTTTPWFTTTESNQTINFADTTEKPRTLNSLVIIADTTDLYIKILPNYENESYLYIPAGKREAIDYCRITGIQILGNSGQKLRWFGLFY